MKAELADKEVLAVYDVRGIQSYIFKTNTVKEIVGASNLVEGLITKGLEAYIKKYKCPGDKYILDWKREAIDFLADSSVQMEVMFVGGGNAYVLFRKGAECQKVNRFLAKYVLEQTYSLNLAVAVVEKTDSYKKDYEAINIRLREIKAGMPATQPMGALPFMAADAVTGYPITEYDKQLQKYLCHESALKRAKAVDKDGNQVGEKILDDMVTEKGDNSSLALCHIDGNSMGLRIQAEMRDIASYSEAVPKMRRLSQEIAQTFEGSFKDMCTYIDEIAPSIKKMSSGKHLYRKIVLAGDDITFVCNAKAAIPAVKRFLGSLGEKAGGYSACGGIAFFNSHFSFSDAYEVAEACCDSAKQRAKEKDNRKADGAVGCFFDYQICTNIRAAKLDSYRDKNYVIRGKSFIARPYFVASAGDNGAFVKQHEKYSVEKLTYWLDYFTGKDIPRSKAKELRNIIPQGENAIRRELSFLKSRGIDLEVNDGYENDIYKVWYDALEIMDLYVSKEAADEDNN